MIKAGFYIIKDEFFTEMNDPYLKGNKQGNRPHYYCFKDNEDGIFWVIPLSSRIEKYKKLIQKIESKKSNGNVEAWCKIYADKTRYYENIRKIEK